MRLSVPGPRTHLASPLPPEDWRCVLFCPIRGGRIGCSNTRRFSLSYYRESRSEVRSDYEGWMQNRLSQRCRPSICHLSVLARARACRDDRSRLSSCLLPSTSVQIQNYRSATGTESTGPWIRFTLDLTTHLQVIFRISFRSNGLVRRLDRATTPLELAWMTFCLDVVLSTEVERGT